MTLQHAGLSDGFSPEEMRKNDKVGPGRLLLGIWRAPWCGNELARVAPCAGKDRKADFGCRWSLIRSLSCIEDCSALCLHVGTLRNAMWHFPWELLLMSDPQKQRGSPEVGFSVSGSNLAKASQSLRDAVEGIPEKLD